MNQPVYLIDASIYIFRAYFSMPDRWHSPEGHSVNALYGYVQFLLQFLQRSQGKLIASAFDESLGTCFRNDIYPGYKANRSLPDEELAFQLSACKNFTEILGIKTLASKRYEADDLIATLASVCQNQDIAICVVTRDKDLGQLLINKNDSWWDFAANTLVKKHDFSSYFGVESGQVVDYLALVGDRIDNVPGVPGIGAKTAMRLLEQFGSVDQMYQNVDAILNSSIRGAKSIVDKLLSYRGQIDMAKTLVRLHSQIPISITYKDLYWRAPDIELVLCFLEKFGLGGRFDKQLSQLYQ